MYSLVSAPVLGFDLARLPGGSSVAAVLVRGLLLTESDLGVVATAPLDDDERLELWQDVEAAARQRRELRDQSTAAELAAVGDPSAEPSLELAGALTVLERAPLGTIDGLLHCVRHDVLDWSWRSVIPNQRRPVLAAPAPAPRREQSMVAGRATSVLCDAVAAAYLNDLMSDETVHRLTGPWEAISTALPERRADLGPQQDVILRLLGRVSSLPADDLDRLVRVAENSRGTLAEWAPAVHAASWAVYLSGRVRGAAAAQLLLVAAIDRAGVKVADRAGGVWNLLSGAVQALVVRDLLDTTTFHRLIDPFLAALGPIPRR